MDVSFSVNRSRSPFSVSRDLALGRNVKSPICNDASSLPSCSSQMSPDPRHEDGEPERFADAVVGTGFERQHDVLVGSTTAQHDDGMMEATGSERLDHLLAVLIRQVEVHDHEVRPPVAESVVDLACTGYRGSAELGMAGNLFRKRRPEIVVRRRRSGCCVHEPWTRLSNF